MIIDVTNPPVCFFLHPGWARTPISNLVWLDLLFKPKARKPISNEFGLR